MATEDIKLYQYQADARDAMRMKTIGQVIMCTGSGKTFVQAAYLSEQMETPSVHLVVIPRILLSYQILREYDRFFLSHGQTPEYLFVHSGSRGDRDYKEIKETRKSLKDENFELIATTTVAKVEEVVREYLKKGKSIVIFTTYDSFERAANGVEAAGQRTKCIIFDEAHFLTQENYFKKLGGISSDERFFFTATPKHSECDQSFGMNNVTVYGEVIYYLGVASAISAGICVRPRAHLLRSEHEYNSDDFKKSIPKIIANAVREHEAKLAGEKTEHNIVRLPRVLVALKGTKNIKLFFDSKYCEQLTKEGYKVFAISSSGGAVINSLKNVKSRQEWLRSLKNALQGGKEKVIVLHYDILSEGIDASGFTAGLLLRGMGDAKFFQTFGRINRLDPVDRAAFKDGTITPSETEKMRKPFAYLMFPVFTNGGDLNDSALFRKRIMQMRTLGVQMNEIIQSQEFGDSGSKLDPLKKNELKRQMGQIIEDIYSEVEEEEEAKRLFGADTLDEFFDILEAV